MTKLTYLSWHRTFFQRKVAKTPRRKAIYFFLAPWFLDAFALIFWLKEQSFPGNEMEGCAVTQAGGRS